MQNQRDLKALNILLGSACNMRCPYCLQRDDNSVTARKANLDWFIAMLKKRLSYYSNVNTVHYWGGEPLLYWQNIKKIYLEIKDDISPKFHRITTNGTMVDDEYIDFCNAHPDIVTVISFHDGQLTNSQWEKIVKLDNFNIEALFHHKRTDPRALKKDWEKICGMAGRKIPIGFDFLKATEGVSSEYRLKEEDLAMYFYNILEIFQEANSYPNNEFAKTVISHFIFRYQADKGSGYKLEGCCVNPSVLSVDLHGNTYGCHHNNSRNNICGFIAYPNAIPIIQHGVPNPKRYLQNEECQKCNALDSCYGGCYLSEEHEIECAYHKARALMAEHFLNLILRENDR
jgi:radical SAM protein with 4Fe4S-binding SPASM domain